MDQNMLILARKGCNRRQKIRGLLEDNASGRINPRAHCLDIRQSITLTIFQPYTFIIETSTDCCKIINNLSSVEEKMGSGMHSKRPCILRE